MSVKRMSFTVLLGIILTISGILVSTTMVKPAFADRGDAVTVTWYGTTWMGRSAAYETTNKGLECGEYHAWTKITNSDIPAKWLRSRMFVYSYGNLVQEKVMENDFNMVAGYALDNMYYHYSSKYEYRQTYARHALYRNGPVDAAGASYFTTEADEDSKY